MTRFAASLLGAYVLLLAGLLWVLSGCDHGTISGPTPTTTTTAPPEQAPRVDQPFSWDHYQGFTAFALGEPGQTEADIMGLFAEAMAHGWNTARVCSETENWDGDPPYLVRKPRDPERLRWTLDIIARIPGAQVLLVGDCTMKGPVPESEKRSWARLVAAVVSGVSIQGTVSATEPFKNVAIETHNEFDNCRGRGWGPHCPGKQDVSAHVAIYRSAGIEFVTADDSLCAGPDERKTYLFRLSNIGAWPADFHPCREVRDVPWDPLREGPMSNAELLSRYGPLAVGDTYFLQRLVEVNGGTALLSETVAWADISGVCDGLRTCDPERIQSYVDRCAAVRGCKFTYHSELLLGGQRPTWWPTAR